jgi:hypothetical protein
MVIRNSEETPPLQIMTDQKLENAKYFDDWDKAIANYAKRTCEMKSRIVTEQAVFNRKKTLFTSKLDLNFRKKLEKCCISSITLYGAETWTLQKAYQKYLENFEMWCWRRMEMISWTELCKKRGSTA